MRKRLLALPLAKSRLNSEGISQAYKMFIYGDMHSITNSLCTNVLRIGTPHSRLLIAFFYHFFTTVNIFSFHMKYRKIQTYNYTYKYLYIYSFFIPLPEFHVARKQIKVCPTCPQYMKG